MGNGWALKVPPSKELPPTLVLKSNYGMVLNEAPKRAEFANLFLGISCFGKRFER